MSTKTLFHGYRHDPKMLKPYRIAHALDWAAIHHKAEPMPYNLLLKAIEGYDGRTPSLKSKEVESMRNSMHRAREILRVQYNRGLVTVPGIGVRATVDDLDEAHNDVKPQLRRYVLAGESLKKKADMVNINKIPNTKENQPIRAWLEKTLKPHVKQIDSGALQKLLPPVNVTPDKKKNDE
jgi:hypothetical protein